MITVPSLKVLLVFKTNQSPEIWVRTNDHVTSTTSITTIGASFGYIFLTM
jgi:hypothetical protein